MLRPPKSRAVLDPGVYPNPRFLCLCESNRSLSSDGRVRRNLFRLRLSSSKQLSLFKGLSHFICPHNFSGNSDKLETLLSSKCTDWQSRSRGGGHSWLTQPSDSLSVRDLSRKELPRHTEDSIFILDRLSDSWHIKPLFMNCIFCRNTITTKSPFPRGGKKPAHMVSSKSLLLPKSNMAAK